MGIALGVFLVLAALTAVACPLLKSRGTGRGRRPANAALRVLADARDELNRQLQRLELDRASGLVEEEDFRAQMEELRVSAAALLLRDQAPIRRSVDRAAAEVELEKEIELARAALAGSSGSATRTGRPASDSHGRDA